MRRLLLTLGVHGKEDVFKLLRQFFKFGIVGLSNTLISLAIYYTFVFFGVYYILSNIIAFVVSVLNAYYWNSKYVFKKSEENKMKPLAKVYASYGLTFLLSTGLLFLMVDILGISKMIAPVMNLCVTIPLNFLLNKLWVFR